MHNAITANNSSPSGSPSSLNGSPNNLNGNPSNPGQVKQPILRASVQVQFPSPPRQ